METEDQSILTQEYEYALRALNDRQFRQSDEFITWLREESHRALFQELMDNREALMNLNAEIAPDIDKAWKRMNPKPKVSHRKYYLWTACAAAIALLLIGISILLPESQLPVEAEKVSIVFSVSNELEEVVLLTGNGEMLTVSDTEGNSLTARTGLKVQQETIDYQQAEESLKTVTTHTLSTPRGKNFKIVLEDGTEVWLNAESKLHYPTRFTGKERRVELEGEAFFHVAKDASHPFIVKSGTAETRVLGTQFNFRAYPHEARHVTLVTGSVIVSDSNKENEIQLSPGQDVPLDENDKLLIPRHIDISEYTAWKDDLFCFRETKLIDIMKSIGRWYNLTIAFADQASMNYHFNFWAPRNDSPEEMLKLLNAVGKVKATLEGNQITISKP